MITHFMLVHTLRRLAAARSACSHRLHNREKIVKGNHRPCTARSCSPQRHLLPLLQLCAPATHALFWSPKHATLLPLAQGLIAPNSLCLRALSAASPPPRLLPSFRAWLEHHCFKKAFPRQKDVHMMTPCILSLKSTNNFMYLFSMDTYE